MRTQITCPNCGTPYTADIYQVVDAAREPQLKEMLLTGQLNVAVCPNCGAGGRIATPLLYHDPAHDLFMVHVPQELNLDQVRREELIGRLAQQVMNSTPPEKRRGYMLNPQMMLTMQGFLEKVLETEGITPDMIARQQKQVDLLRTLSTASPDVVDYLVKERANEIDETFFSILRQQIDAVSQSGDPNRVVPLLNLQAKLMTETPAGRELERRQMALHALNRDAKKEGGVTPKLLLKHILLNKDDMGVVNIMVISAQPAMNYEFFSLLTAEVDKAEKAKDTATAKQLATLRDSLLQVQEEVQNAEKQVLQSAKDTLDEILAAPNTEEAMMQNMGRIDDAFLHVLQARMAYAEQTGRQDELDKLDRIQAFLVQQVQGDAPIELQFLNELMMADTAEKQQRLLEDNADLITPDLLAVVDALQKQSQAEGRGELADRLNQLSVQLRAAGESAA